MSAIGKSTLRSIAVRTTIPERSVHDRQHCYAAAHRTARHQVEHAVPLRKVD